MAELSTVARAVAGSNPVSHPPLKNLIRMWLRAEEKPFRRDKQSATGARPFKNFLRIAEEVPVAKTTGPPQEPIWEN